MMKSMVRCWWDKFSKWFYASSLDQINQQSYIRLSTSFQNIEKKGPTIPYIEEQLEKLRNDPDWNTVKSIELLLIPLLGECDLDIELHYQLHKASTLLNSQEYDFFRQEFESIKQDGSVHERKRALLSKLTASLHKYYEDRQLRSLYANKARLKIGVFFSLAIVFSVFLLAIGILHPDGIYQYLARFFSATPATADSVPTQYVDKIHLHYAVTALMAGCMGACFSMLISLKNRVETITLQELENQHSLHFILTRIITGVGAALVCYYFFRAELLSGSLFPDFGNEQEINLNSATFFTLIIWCFIAGFSEKLVPSILSKTEAQIDKKR
ncbi:hypothetical protein [Methylomarinum vadi]|uniref:hypothetical protein n=1 Tax=Methylomarinum vadi TaxID=438855 RepID=UPI0013646A79|nr:hypothetical protein [Methylomarinum vadi]